MKLANLMGRLSAEDQTKTAAATTPAAPASSKLDESINAAMAEIAAKEKTASTAAQPTNDLQKLASEVANSNRDAEVAHAEKVGAAMADGFVRQVAAYEAAANQIVSEKTAQLNLSAEEIAMIEESRTNPRAFVEKMAAFRDQLSAERPLTEKEAHDVWNATAEETVRVIHKIAMDHYAAGYSAITEALK